MRLFLTLFLCLRLLGAADRYPAINRLVKPLIKEGEPGAAVMVRQSGRTVFTRGYGLANIAKHNKITVDTNFRLASVTKQFTAMAIMLLVQDGKLSYDRTLADLFPGFPVYGSGISVRHLLTHTSGLLDYEDLMDAGKWTSTHQISDGEVFELLAHQDKTRFPPGTRWAYSNSGYVVLGLVVAKVAGMPFGEFLRKRIFKPLHMAHTLVYVNGQNTVVQRAYGYSKRDGKLAESDQSATSATQGDGGIYSNLRDLARWDDALRTGRLLAGEEMAAALEPVKPSPDDGTLYGFGWFLNALGTHRRMWHYGSTSGFRSAIERFPQDNETTIVILSNRTDVDPADLAEKIAAAVIP